MTLFAMWCTEKVKDENEKLKIKKYIHKKGIYLKEFMKMLMKI